MQNLRLFDIEVDPIALNLANNILSVADRAIDSSEKLRGIEQSITKPDKNPVFYDSSLEERLAKIKIAGNYSKEQLKTILAGIKNKAATSAFKVSTEAWRDLPITFDGLMSQQEAYNSNYIVPETFDSIITDVANLVMQGKSFEEIETWICATTK
jgi:hypothetical protein